MKPLSSSAPVIIQLTHKTFNKNSIIIKINFRDFGYIFVIDFDCKCFCNQKSNFSLPTSIIEKINVAEFFHFFEHQVEAVRMREKKRKMKFKTLLINQHHPSCMRKIKKRKKFCRTTRERKIAQH